MIRYDAKVLVIDGKYAGEGDHGLFHPLQLHQADTWRFEEAKFCEPEGTYVRTPLGPMYTTQVRPIAMKSLRSVIS